MNGHAAKATFKRLPRLDEMAISETKIAYFLQHKNELNFYFLPKLQNVAQILSHCLQLSFGLSKLFYFQVLVSLSLLSTVALQGNGENIDEAGESSFTISFGTQKEV